MKRLGAMMTSSSKNILKELIENEDVNKVYPISFNDFSELMRDNNLITRKLLVLDMRSAYIVRIRGLSKVQLLIDKQATDDKDRFQAYDCEFIQPYKRDRGFIDFLKEEYRGYKKTPLLSSLCIVFLVVVGNMPVSILAALFSALTAFIAIFVSFLVVFWTMDKRLNINLYSFTNGNLYYELQNDRYLALLAFIGLGFNITGILLAEYKPISKVRLDFAAPIAGTYAIIIPLISLIAILWFSIYVSLLLISALYNYYFIKSESEIMGVAKEIYFEAFDNDHDLTGPKITTTR